MTPLHIWVLCFKNLCNIFKSFSNHSFCKGFFVSFYVKLLYLRGTFLRNYDSSRPQINTSEFPFLQPAVSCRYNYLRGSYREWLFLALIWILLFFFLLHSVIQFHWQKTRRESAFVCPSQEPIAAPLPFLQGVRFTGSAKRWNKLVLCRKLIWRLEQEKSSFLTCRCDMANLHRCAMTSAALDACSGRVASPFSRLGFFVCEVTQF